MYTCQEHKFVFLCGRKTASTSMVEYLKKYYHMEGTEFAHGWKRPSYAKSWKGYLFVRNPYSRACSQWWFRLNRKHHDLQFEDWLQEEFFPQVKLLQAYPEVVSRFEDLPHSFYELPLYRGGELPRVNVNFPGKPPNEELLTDKAKKIIRERYADDFNEFGYEA